MTLPVMSSSRFDALEGRDLAAAQPNAESTPAFTGQTGGNAEGHEMTEPRHVPPSFALEQAQSTRRDGSAAAEKAALAAAEAGYEQARSSQQAPDPVSLLPSHDGQESGSRDAEPDLGSHATGFSKPLLNMPLAGGALPAGVMNGMPMNGGPSPVAAGPVSAGSPTAAAGNRPPRDFAPYDLPGGHMMQGAFGGPGPVSMPFTPIMAPPGMAMGDGMMFDQSSMFFPPSYDPNYYMWPAPQPDAELQDQMFFMYPQEMLQPPMWPGAYDGNMPPVMGGYDPNLPPPCEFCSCGKGKTDGRRWEIWNKRRQNLCTVYRVAVPSLSNRSLCFFLSFDTAFASPLR